MENVIEKIQTLLADEESMKQIQELYKMLSGESPPCDAGEEDTAGTEETSECEAPETDNSDDCDFSFDNMGFDFETLLKLQGLFGSCQCNKNSELLTALKPHLSEAKQCKVDKAIKIMHIIDIVNVLKESGLLKDIDKML